MFWPMSTHSRNGASFLRIGAAACLLLGAAAAFAGALAAIRAGDARPDAVRSAFLMATVFGSATAVGVVLMAIAAATGARSRMERGIWWALGIAVALALGGFVAALLAGISDSLA